MNTLSVQVFQDVQETSPLFSCSSPIGGATTGPGTAQPFRPPKPPFFRYVQLFPGRRCVRHGWCRETCIARATHIKFLRLIRKIARLIDNMQFEKSGKDQHFLKCLLIFMAMSTGN